jgi:hypothetical protein
MQMEASSHSITGRREIRTSPNQASPRLHQSQEKHCTRMKNHRTKQSPELERQQQQMVLLQRITQQSECLHANSSTKQLHELHSSPAPSHRFEHQWLGGKSDREPTVALSQHQQQPNRHQLPNQFIQTQQRLRRGSETLRQVVENSQYPQCPANFERIFAILERMQVNCQTFDVLKFCVTVVAADSLG